MSILVRALGLWLWFGAVYLLLAGDVSGVELGAAGVCATVGTAFALGLRRVTDRDLRLRPSLPALLRSIRALLPETFGVGQQLAAALFGTTRQRGAFIPQPFEPGDVHDGVAAGRRALAVLGLSLAPGAFVIRGERSDTLVLHAMPARAPSPNPRWPT